jgi:activator of 2-hydroxyglutaryl-CoA dehydratase
MKKAYLGIDVGSVSTNLIVIDEQYEVLASLYLRTQGQPIRVIQEWISSQLDSVFPSRILVGWL